MSDLEQNQISKEYSKIIKESIESGDFYKESIKWYIFQYIRPIVDRNNMILFFLIGAFTTYILYTMINDTFPLVEEFPVIIKEKNTSLYNPVIKKLKNSEEDKKLSVDEAILKTLITNYIKNRESFDFSDANVDDVNKKFNQIKNNSSFLEYKNFQQLMDKSNPSSPIVFFGKVVKKTIEIKDLKFISRSKRGNFISKFFTASIPEKAEVKFSSKIIATNQDNKSQEKSQNYFVKISFDYQEVDRDNSDLRRIGFIVKKYELFEVK